VTGSTLLSQPLVETVIRLLSKELCCLMVMDNFQRGNQLRHPTPDTPCFSGARVAAYHKAIRIRRNLLAIRNSLSHGYNVDINRNVLSKFERYTREALESGFFKSVLEF